MNRTALSIANLVLITGLMLTGRVEAQQQQHHPPDTQTSQEQTSEATQPAPARPSIDRPMHGMMQQMHGMMQQMHGMMQQMQGRMGRGMMRDQENDDSSDAQGKMGRGMRGHGGRMGHGMMRGHGRMMGHMHRQLGRLTKELNLSDEQQSKVQALMLTRVKDGIRLQADIDMANIDLQQLLDAQSVDMEQVKATLQAIAGKEAELRLTHISAMQDIRNMLTPDQQKQFRAVWGHMMGGGGKMGRHSMMGHHGMKKHGRQMGRMRMKGQGGMNNPCGMPHGKPNK